MTEHRTPDGEILFPQNGRPTIPHPAASVIDLPVEPVTADVGFDAIKRLEAKIDAQARQIQWVVDTVTQFVEGIKASPMAGMLNRGKK